MEKNSFGHNPGGIVRRWLDRNTFKVPISPVTVKPPLAPREETYKEA